MSTEHEPDTPGPTPAPPARGVPGRTDLLIAAAFASAVFGGNLAIERAFDARKALTAYDVLFDADPITRLDSISNGRCQPNEKIVHPGLRVFFSRPIRLAGKVARGAGLIADTGRAEYALHRGLGLLVIPAASGLTMAGVYALFLAGGLGRPRTVLMTLGCSVSFSQMVFGSVPDHMPLSGLAVTVLFLLAAELVRGGGAVRPVAWPVAGGLFAAVTITNAAPFVILFATALRLSGRPWREVARVASGVTAGMLVVVATTFLASSFVSRETPTSLRSVRNHARNYFHARWSEAPSALLETLSPAALRTFRLPEPIVASNLYSAGRLAPGIACASDQPRALVALVSALLLTGAAGCLRAGNTLRGLGAAALGVLAFHLTLHSNWGSPFFFYSQHWLVPEAVLLAGNLAWPGRVGKAFAGLYAAGVAAMFVHNSALVNQILDVISTASA